MIAHAAAHGVAPKVLVIDDEEDIITYLVTLLEDNGFRGVGERDATASMAAALRERPDLILLDIMMPGQSGLSLYRALRRNPATAAIPIFIMSGFSREGDLAQTLLPAEANGLPQPDGYLEKPISVPRFLQRLQDLFDKAGPEG